MVVKIIKDIQENKELGTILDDLSSVWETVQSDKIAKAMGGTRNMNNIEAVMDGMIYTNNPPILEINDSANSLANNIRMGFANKLNNERGNK